MRTVTIEVPDTLDDIARRQGRSPEDLARQAISEWVSGMMADDEDRRIAQERWAEIEAGAVESERWDGVKAELGVLPGDGQP